MILRVFFLAIVLTGLCENLFATRAEKDRRKDRSKLADALNNGRNPCEIDGKDTPFYCGCDGNGEPGKVSTADCMVFHNNISKDFPVWDYFANQPHIKTMKVTVRESGILTFIPTKAIRYLKELRIFEIKYASIDEILPYAFGNLTGLTALKITRNQVVTLNHRAFANLPNLIEIKLDENRISELQRDVFVNLPSLQKLYLSQNNLSIIQEGTFTHLTKLLELELSVNVITVLTKDTFTGLSKLKILDLSSNRISMLGDLTFAELWEIEELLLDSNQIQLIADRAFAGLNFLKKLTLSNNRLKVLSPTLLEDVIVDHLDLRSNYLETITSDTVRPIIKNLYNEGSFFYIEHNRFICDCRMTWMHSLRNDTKSEPIRNVLDELECFLEKSQMIDEKNKTMVVKISDYNFNRIDDTVHVEDTALKKYFFEIPTADLPCPSQEQPTEEPVRKAPTTAKINSGSSAKFSFPSLPFIILLALLT